MGLISGQGTKIPQATWPKKKNKYYKSFLWKLWKEKVNSRQFTIHYYKGRRYVHVIEVLNGAWMVEGTSKGHLAKSKDNFGCYN